MTPSPASSLDHLVGHYYVPLDDRYTELIVGEGEPVLSGQANPYRAPSIVKLHSPPFEQTFRTVNSSGVCVDQPITLAFVEDKRHRILLTRFLMSSCFEQWSDALARRQRLEADLHIEAARLNPRHLAEQQDKLARDELDRLRVAEARRVQDAREEAMVRASQAKGFTPFNRRITR